MIGAALGLGSLVGLILALTGAGGGILAVPLLMFGLHLTIQQAAPVGLLAVGVASGVGALLGLRDGLVRYRAAALIGVTGMMLAPAGVFLAGRLPSAPVQVAFALVLAWVAWRMFGQSRGAGNVDAATRARAVPCAVDPASRRFVWTHRCARALAATGAVSGVLSGLLGVGGGFVIVPSLTRYTDLAAQGVLATSLAVIAMVSVGGVAAAAWTGSIPWPVAIPFGAGATAALLIGRRLAARLAGARLQRAFAVVSASVAVLLLAKGLGWSGVR